MKSLTIIVSLFVLSLAPNSEAFASCSTIGNYTSCSDGNSYTKIGKSTYGSNSRTGSTWSSHQTGKLSYGTDSNGNSWSHYQR